MQFLSGPPNARPFLPSLISAFAFLRYAILDLETPQSLAASRIGFPAGRAMSADAYVSSSRLRAPLNLSSSRKPNRRNIQHRLLNASAAYRGWRGEEREGDPALAGAQLDSDPYDPPLEGSGDVQSVPHWIDMDRYEDWDRPTLEALCPTIRIAYEDDLFPVAVAEDGESLPAEIHPSHPYGNLHQTALSYTSRPKLPPRQGLRYQSAEDNDDKADHMEVVSAPAHLSLRARQGIAPNAPNWPFRRFGPGPGGPNALTRAENTRPWRPYKAVWADLGLEELLPMGTKVKDGLPGRDHEGERAHLPQKGEVDNLDAVLQELDDFDAVHLQSGEDRNAKQGKEKKRRRVQDEWKWGQRQGNM